MTTLREFTEKLSDIRTQKSVLKAEIKELENMEDALEKDILSTMRDQALDAFEAAGLKIRLIKEDVAKPDPAFWEDIFNWVADNNHWHLMMKKLNSAGVREMTRAGMEIPHVEIIEIEKIKILG